jgi:uncharacterized protein
MSNHDDFPTEPPTRDLVVATEESNNLVTRGLEAIKNRAIQPPSLAIDGDSARLLQDARNAYQQGDYETQQRLLLTLAGRGFAEAQVDLGFMYELGREGVTEDNAETVKWYRAAARDRGVTQYDAEAIKWYHEVAEQGGLVRNVSEAVKWYRKAADQGNAEGQVNLGLLYHKGVGVPKDNAEAVKWCRKAAEQGNARGQYWLGFIYFFGWYDDIERNMTQEQEDYAEAVKWYRKAADQGYSIAQLCLGLSITSGIWARIRVQEDYAEAIKWYSLSAEQGEPKAHYQLGLLYEEGKGVQKDCVRAYMWFLLSEKSLFAESAEKVSAQAKLDDIKEYISQEQIAEAQRLAQEWKERHAS